ncbi:MAG: PH domain-containing protein [Flavobacteriales bacterium]|nr:PH domain-containing protein [Flavobacteriales bacterium]
MGLLDAFLGNASSTDPGGIQREYAQLFVDGETVEAGFKLVRDMFIFTNARLILVDVQGLTGKKIEYISIPYRSISRFSVETAGTFDLDADLKIWITSEASPSIQKRFNRSVNIYELQRFLAFHVFGGGSSPSFSRPTISVATSGPPNASSSDRVDDVPIR